MCYKTVVPALLFIGKKIEKKREFGDECGETKVKPITIFKL